jgi:transposase
MPKYLKLVRHLTESEIEERYRQARSGVEKIHYQIIWLMSQGKHPPEIAEVTGYGEPWLRVLIKRYNELGPRALVDSRPGKSGAKRLLTPEQEKSLCAEIDQGLEAGQTWSGPQVAQRMSDLLGQPIYAARGWEFLKRWGYRHKVPRPRHTKADPEKQSGFKKSSNNFPVSTG